MKKILSLKSFCLNTIHVLMASTMKIFYFIIALFFINTIPVFSQEAENVAILKIILTKYYKNEKVIAKERLQLLNFYCNKAPNNEEVLEVISGNELLKKNAADF